MEERAKESHGRSVAKAISWRILGSLDTLLLSYLFTGNLKIAGSIAGAESISKIILYYLHERAWNWMSWRKVRGALGTSHSQARDAAEGEGALLRSGSAA